MELLGDIVRHPAFPEDALASQKTEFVDEFEKAEGRLDNFMPAAAAIAFGKTHPLGNTIGTAESYRSITRQDLMDFQLRYWKPDVAVLAFAGDITLDEAVTIAQKNFGDWEGTAESASPIPTPSATAGRMFL